MAAPGPHWARAGCRSSWSQADRAVSPSFHNHPLVSLCPWAGSCALSPPVTGQPYPQPVCTLRAAVYSLTPVCPFCPGGQQLTPIHLCSNHPHSLALSKLRLPTGTHGHPYECIECRLWAPGHFIQKLVFFFNVMLERLSKSLNLFLKAIPLKGLMWAWGSLHRGSLWCLNLEGLPWGPPACSVSGRRMFSS